MALLLLAQNTHHTGDKVMPTTLWDNYWMARVCHWCGHQTPIRLPYHYMPGKFYLGCSRCGTNLEDTVYGNDAEMNQGKMHNRRIAFEFIFWGFWIAVFLFLGYLSVSWF
jgi:hypothetical protein